MKPYVPGTPKKYGAVVYETFAAAKSDLEQLAAKKAQFDELNIIVKQEGNMDDPELTPFGRIYAGAAWALIHERRVEEKWYDSPH